jgi:hypothetical protein
MNKEESSVERGDPQEILHRAALHLSARHARFWIFYPLRRGQPIDIAPDMSATKWPLTMREIHEVNAILRYCTTALWREKLCNE